jgi:cytochrome b561
VQWLGAQFIDFIPGRPAHQLYWSIHITLGVLADALVVADAVVVAGDGRRAAPSPRTKKAGSAPRASMHVTLNTLLAVIVRARLSASCWRAAGRCTGPFAIPMAPGGSRHLAGQIHTVHEWLADVLVFLATGHALAALFHRYWLRDGVLARMVPWITPSAPRAGAELPRP